MLAAESIVLLKKVRALAQHFALTIVTLENEAGIFPTDPMLVKYVPSNVEVFRIPPIPQPRLVHNVAQIAGQLLFRGSTIARYYDLSWALNATSFMRRELAACRKFDILMTNAQNMCSHVVGHLLQHSLKAPWIQHYSDPFFDSPFRNGHLLSKKLDEWLVRKFLARASLITMPSLEMKAYGFKIPDQPQRHQLLSKMIVVPHTYDIGLMEDALKLYGNRDRYFSDRHAIHVCYVGNLYGPRNAQMVLDASRRMMPQDKDKPIIVHIFGILDRRSKKQLDRVGDCRVVFHGCVSYLESLAIMQQADVLLLIDTPMRQSPFFPSKLADYLGTQKPIIVMAFPDSAVARIARDMNLTLSNFANGPIRLDSKENDSLIAKRALYANRTEIYAELATRLQDLV